MLCKVHLICVATNLKLITSFVFIHKCFHIHTVAKGADKPTIKLLIKYSGKIAPYWYHLGARLFKEKYTYKLRVIQKDHPNDVEVCCDKMLEY